MLKTAFPGGSVHFYCDVCRNAFGGGRRKLVSERLFHSSPYTEQSFYLVSSPQIPAHEFTHLFSFTNKESLKSCTDSRLTVLQL